MDTVEILFLIAGATAIVIVLLDSLWTTLWVDGGAGFLLSRVTSSLWRAWLRVNGGSRHLALSLFGPAVLFGTIMVWVLLMWAGWVLVFASDPNSLVRSASGIPADWTDRIWFVAYAMFTMGNGEIAPNGDAWELVSALTNGSGMFLVTLAVTYLISVVAAVVSKRALAMQVTGMGRDFESVLLTAWNGRDFRSLDLPLFGISMQLSRVSEQYLSYPVLQYYHAGKWSKSPIVAIALLEQILSVLRYAVAEEARPAAPVLQSIESGIEEFLAALPSTYVQRAPDPLPAPCLDRLRRAGVRLIDQQSFEARIGSFAERRRKIAGLLQQNGWSVEEAGSRRSSSNTEGRSAED